jgi:DNA transformation protein
MPRPPGRDRSFHDYVLRDVFHGVRGVRSRAMFGGWGIYKDGVFFALIADGELYFKADDLTRPDFERAGSRPFAYSRKDRKAVTLSYWRLPEDVMERRDELARWVDAAVSAARRKR